MNSYAAMCKKHEKECRNVETHIIIKDGDNVKWDFGTFEQLQKSYNLNNETIQAIKVLCLLAHFRQLDPDTLSFEK